MNIQEKIAEIRRQPEHIRMRWVYGSLLVSMLFVLFIWVLSLKVNFSTGQQSPGSTIEAVRDGFGEFESEQPTSLDDLLQENVQ